MSIPEVGKKIRVIVPSTTANLGPGFDCLGAALDVFKKWNLPILIGASRKRFIGEILNEKNPKERDIGTLAISCVCSQINIDIVRVHNVKLNYQVLKVADRIYRKL